MLANAPQVLPQSVKPALTHLNAREEPDARVVPACFLDVTINRIKCATLTLGKMSKMLSPPRINPPTLSDAARHCCITRYARHVERARSQQFARDTLERRAGERGGTESEPTFPPLQLCGGQVVCLLPQEEEF